MKEIVFEIYSPTEQTHEVKECVRLASKARAKEKKLHLRTLLVYLQLARINEGSDRKTCDTSLRSQESVLCFCFSVSTFSIRAAGVSRCDKSGVDIVQK